MIALIAHGTGVAVVRVTDRGISYRSVNSSAGVIIGQLPGDGHVGGGLVSMVARKPVFRKAFIVVEFADGAVFAAQMGRGMKLGNWKYVDDALLSWKSKAIRRRRK